jgi:hypothetical protein
VDGVREDPINASLLYAGTGLGVYASLDKGATWFTLDNNLPTVPVYDLQVYPRDRELISGTHGRGVQILDVSAQQQFTTAAMSASAVLFKPTLALQYGERPVGSEPRAQRMWRGDRVPAGAAITYRLAAPVTGGATRITVLNAAGDTVARLLGTNTAGLNTVTWNLHATGARMQGPNAGGRGGFGGGFGCAPPPSGTISDPGSPVGFSARPAEARGAADSTGTPENQAKALIAAQNRAPAAGGAGGGGFGGGRTLFVDTGVYRIMLERPGEPNASSQSLRVVRVSPDERAILVPARR